MRLFSALLLTIALSSYANAVIVVEYLTAGGTDSIAAGSADAAVTSDNLVAGGGLNVENFSTFNFSDWDTASASFADAVAADDFWTWGFDVTAPLTTVSPTTMDIRLDRSGTGPDDFEIQASVNGGGAITLLTHDFGDSSSGVDFLGVDISTIGDLNTGDSVVFTLAAFNSESSNGTFDLETADFGGSDPRALRIEGTISAVPEPSAFLFGTLICGVLGAKYSRKRDRS